ncbi:alpha/beta fold hydrolase [Streptomyces sp. GbtcB7]|uniref:alpha/beta fold hydrolase n=1 Tax=Streptomyces sp. GbtcB7 TaxID=2824752 RepID=UPI001C30B078|nr:alpha/beta fold hydrolase [Streptomyces sp. GbtcB7]
MTTTPQNLTRESTSRYADLKEMRVHYHDAGSGPVLLMLHGGGPGASGWSNFKQNLATLTPHFRLLIVDQPGFGLTDKPEHDEPQHELTARVLIQLLDHLGVDKVTPVGNSMGGAASLEFTLSYPERVDRLILMAPAGGALPITSDNVTTEGKSLVRFAQAPSPEAMKALVDALTFDGDAIPAETLKERYEAAVEPESLAYNARMFKNWITRGLSPKHWKRVGEITHETLLLWGREDHVLPLDSSLHILHQMANARLHVVPNCGHWVMVEAQQEFEQQILTFMRADG